MQNNEAISNSSSPLENEKIKNSLEQQRNKDKIDLPVELTEEQRKQEELLTFGQTKTPFCTSATSAASKRGGKPFSSAASSRGASIGFAYTRKAAVAAAAAALQKSPQNTTAARLEGTAASGTTKKK